MFLADLPAGSQVSKIIADYILFKRLTNVGRFCLWIICCKLDL